MTGVLIKRVDYGQRDRQAQREDDVKRCRGRERHVTMKAETAVMCLHPCGSPWMRCFPTAVLSHMLCWSTTFPGSVVYNALNSARVARGWYGMGWEPGSGFGCSAGTAWLLPGISESPFFTASPLCSGDLYPTPLQLYKNPPSSFFSSQNTMHIHSLIQ